MEIRDVETKLAELKKVENLTSEQKAEKKLLTDLVNHYYTPILSKTPLRRWA